VAYHTKNGSDPVSKKTKKETKKGGCPVFKKRGLTRFKYGIPAGLSTQKAQKWDSALLNAVPGWAFHTKNGSDPVLGASQSRFQKNGV
jgi:hypothetical protein